MELSQFKHARISQSGNLISFIHEYKRYILIKIIDCKKQIFFHKKYYNIIASSIIKYFFVKETLIVFYTKNSLYYLDSISLKNNNLLTQRIFKTNMPNCNLFYCTDYYAITSFEKDACTREFISSVYIFKTKKNECKKIIELPGIIEQIFTTSKKLYLNLINSQGLKKILVLENQKNIYELIDDYKKLSLQILDANDKYLVCSGELFDETINFVIYNGRLNFFNLSSITNNQISYAKLYNDYLCIIANKGCNDEFFIVNLKDNSSHLISNIGTNIRCVSYDNNMMFYFQCTYNSLSYCSYNLCTGNRTIVWENKHSINSIMCVENIKLSERTLEFMHFYNTGESKGTIFYLHGGPSTHFKNEYNQVCDLRSSAGYDIICLNYRGSTGYGKDFQKQIDRNWGIKEIEDVIEVTEKYSSSNNILLGESYGAFLCLHSILKNSKLWKKCCMLSPFLTPLSMYNNPDCANKYLFKSQLNSKINDCDFNKFEKIDCKILIIHGTNDSVIPISESEKIVEILEHNKKIMNSDFWFIKGNFKHSFNYQSEFHFFKNILNSFLTQ